MLQTLQAHLSWSRFAAEEGCCCASPTEEAGPRVGPDMNAAADGEGGSAPAASTPGGSAIPVRISTAVTTFCPAWCRAALADASSNPISVRHWTSAAEAAECPEAGVDGREGEFVFPDAGDDPTSTAVARDNVAEGGGGGDGGGGGGGGW